MLSFRILFFLSCFLSIVSCSSDNSDKSSVTDYDYRWNLDSYPYPVNPSESIEGKWILISKNVSLHSIEDGSTSTFITAADAFMKMYNADYFSRDMITIKAVDEGFSFQSCVSGEDAVFSFDDQGISNTFSAMGNSIALVKVDNVNMTFFLTDDNTGNTYELKKVSNLDSNIGYFSITPDRPSSMEIDCFYEYEYVFHGEIENRITSIVGKKLDPGGNKSLLIREARLSKDYLDWSEVMFKDFSNLDLNISDFWEATSDDSNLDSIPSVSILNRQGAPNDYQGEIYFPSSDRLYSLNFTLQ